jgi:hypothetical protein
MTAAVESLHDGVGYRIVAWRNIVIVSVCGVITAPDVDAMADAVRKIGARTGGKVGLLHTLDVPGAVAPPDDAARKSYQRLMNDRESPIGSSAIVLDRTGFTAAMVRTVLSGLLLVTRPNHVARVFPSLRDACEWTERELAAIGRSQCTAEGLLAVVEKIPRGRPAAAPA